MQNTETIMFTAQHEPIKQIYFNFFFVRLCFSRFCVCFFFGVSRQFFSLALIGLCARFLLLRLRSMNSTISFFFFSHSPVWLLFEFMSSKFINKYYFSLRLRCCSFVRYFDSEKHQLNRSIHRCFLFSLLVSTLFEFLLAIRSPLFHQKSHKRRILFRFFL